LPVNWELLALGLSLVGNVILFLGARGAVHSFQDRLASLEARLEQHDHDNKSAARLIKSLLEGT
jgi:hypothetical protein